MSSVVEEKLQLMHCLISLKDGSQTDIAIVKEASSAGWLHTWQGKYAAPPAETVISLGGITPGNKTDTAKED